VFNEKGSSSLTISGVTYDSGGPAALGGQRHRLPVEQHARQHDQHARCGADHAADPGVEVRLEPDTVQTRQDFTKEPDQHAGRPGGDSLVLADTNEEGANLLALQTRQQLSTTALSLANQSNQAVLRCSLSKPSINIRRRGSRPRRFLFAACRCWSAFNLSNVFTRN